MSERPGINDPGQCTGKTKTGRRCSKAAIAGTTRCAHHTFRIPGRPSKLTADLQERILDSVLEGNYLEVSAQAAGIDKTTLYRWLRRADDLLASAMEHVDDDVHELPDLYQHVDPADWVYLDFRHALKSAEAFSETELLRRASTGALGWQAPMTILERRHGVRWRRNDRLGLELPEGAAVTVEKVTPPDEKRAKVAGILASAGALDLDEPGDENTHDEEDPDP